MFKVKIDSKQLEYMLKEKEARAKDSKSLMKDIEGDLQDSKNQNFARQGRPMRWQRLKDTTLKARAKKGRSGKILQVKRQLLSSINSRSTDTKAIIGTNKSYARIHNEGGTIKHPGTDKGFGRGVHIPGHDIKMPKRPFLRLLRKERANIFDKIRKYFEK